MQLRNQPKLTTEYETQTYPISMTDDQGVPVTADRSNRPVNLLCRDDSAGHLALCVRERFVAGSELDFWRYDVGTHDVEDHTRKGEVFLKPKAVEASTLAARSVHRMVMGRYGRISIDEAARMDMDSGSRCSSEGWRA